MGIEETSSSKHGAFILKIKSTISFSSAVVINYGIEKRGRVSLRIYDITGKMVKELVNKRVGPGNYTVTWDGTNSNGKKVRNGHYFVNLESDKLSRREKVIVIQ